jgi:hypothetical protein
MYDSRTIRFTAYVSQGARFKCDLLSATSNQYFAKRSLTDLLLRCLSIKAVLRSLNVTFTRYLEQVVFVSTSEAADSNNSGIYSRTKVGRDMSANDLVEAEVTRRLGVETADAPC